MLERQHNHPALSEPVQLAPSSGGAGGESLDQFREAGESLLRAADDAVQRALTGDSHAFLEATRQDGGQ